MKDKPVSGATNHPVRQFVADITRAMCSRPAHCEVTASLSEDGKLLIEIEPDQADYGAVSGKGGRTFKALRFLTERIAWLADHQVAELELAASYEGFRSTNGPRNNPLTKAQILQMANLLLSKALGRPINLKLERYRDGWKLAVPVRPTDPDELAVVAACDEVIFPAAKANGLTVRTMTERSHGSSK